MPILHAPILEQAGFVSGALEPVKNYVYRLDGLTKYYQLSEPLEFNVGDTLEFGFIGGNFEDSFRSFISSTDVNLRISTGSNPQKFDIASTSGAKVNGIAIINNQTDIPKSGLNTLEFKSFTNYLFKGFGARVALNGSAILHLNIAFYNFRVIRNGEVIHEIPLTNRAQGATQLPTVGNVSATIINYTESGWEEV